MAPPKNSPTRPDLVEWFTISYRTVYLGIGGLLVAGASYRGEFESRLNGLLEECRQARGSVLLFIDEIHQLLGLGRAGGGAMDAANLMKPALARGELWCVGATTYEEYRLVEADAAFRRRFQPVDVPELEEALRNDWQLDLAIQEMINESQSIDADEILEAVTAAADEAYEGKVALVGLLTYFGVPSSLSAELPVARLMITCGAGPTQLK